MKQILNTLYVTLPEAYVRLENDTLCIQVERENRLRVPLHHLGSLVCFGEVSVSPIALHRCAEEGISVVLLDRNGRFKARLEGPVSGNILLRQAQHRVACDEAFALDVSRAIIAGKIKNSRHVLLRGARDAKDDADVAALRRMADALADALRRLEYAGDLDTVRGIEGETAKNYFGALRYLIRSDAREAFAMNGRSKRPPQDRINALLSFLYALVMNDCRSAVEAVGLDPQLGFLHAVRPGRAALALDMMEEFRAVVADRLALTLINRGQIGVGDFMLREGGGVHLGDDGRKKVLVAYQERKQEELIHPLLETQINIGLLPMLQARFMARTIREEMEGYLPFLAR